MKLDSAGFAMNSNRRQIRRILVTLSCDDPLVIRHCLGNHAPNQSPTGHARKGIWKDNSLATQSRTCFMDGKLIRARRLSISSVCIVSHQDASRTSSFCKLGGGTSPGYLMLRKPHSQV